MPTSPQEAATTGGLLSAVARFDGAVQRVLDASPAEQNLWSLVAAAFQVELGLRRLDGLIEEIEAAAEEQLAA